MRRQLQPEILDRLPADDCEAIASRRDLRRLNAMMGNWRWLARTLKAHIRLHDRVLEVGAGRGEFLRWWAGVAPALVRTIAIRAVDLAPRPENWPEQHRWVQTNLVHYAGYGECDVVLANLVLHHFDAAALAELGRRLGNGPRPRVVLASEPARRRSHLWQARLLPLLGVNRVTRHDAPVSVRAGFRGRELPTLLNWDDATWRVGLAHDWRGAYRMIAVRRGADA